MQGSSKKWFIKCDLHHGHRPLIPTVVESRNAALPMREIRHPADEVGSSQMCNMVHWKTKSKWYSGGALIVTSYKYLYSIYCIDTLHSTVLLNNVTLLLFSHFSSTTELYSQIRKFYQHQSTNSSLLLMLSKYNEMWPFGTTGILIIGLFYLWCSCKCTAHLK